MSKKKAVACAVQGLVASSICTLAFGPDAHAQSSVTLYGIVDAALNYTSKTLTSSGAAGPHAFSLASGGENASRFGLRGTEDLGGGVSAIFQLESGVSVANGGFGGNGTFFNRKAWVGLAGGFGTITAGLQNSPFLLSVYAIDPRDQKNLGSGIVNYVDNVYVTGLFNPNAVMYTSPEIAGIQGRAMIALGGSPGNFQAGREYSGSLDYHLSGLRVTAAMYSGNAGGSAASLPIPSTVAFAGRNIGAAYSFDKITVKAGYTLYKLAHSFDSRVYSGGFSWLVTPSLNWDAGVYYTSDGNDSRNHSILAGTGLDYFLSKRTDLYSQVGYVNNHGRMNTGVNINGPLFGAAGSTASVDVGIRHLF
ncbi:porin [Burkholderia guangdongensis]|uniref:porin n=1 Tax=Burkholderia guangdongensis TaxID=1792500 RepID=UPI0015C78B55|nr:porin [Burkholderia guangdongensis]